MTGQVRKIIGRKGCPATMEPLEKALMDPNGFPDASGGHIQRTATAYAEVARPLLQVSPKIVLEVVNKLKLSENLRFEVK